MAVQYANISTLQYSKLGFTLVEMMIAMTIFGMMSIMAMTIYFSTTEQTRKLNTQRQLTESARSIIDRISYDIGVYGFSGETVFDPNYDLWQRYDYTGSGSEYLNLVNGRYVYGKKTVTGISPCIDTLTIKNKTDLRIHCGLYFIKYDDNGISGYNLVDSSNPDESTKRVKIRDLRFYISGDGVSTPRKVMISMDLMLRPIGGISTNLASTMTLHIQTTLSERGWKQ